MPYDGSGNFTRLYNWTADKLAAIKIQSVRMDNEANDYATAFNSVILRNGVAPFTGTLKLNNNNINGLANGTAGAPSLNFNTDATSGLYLPAAGMLSLAAGGVERLRVNSTGGYFSGSFGVGTTTAPRTVLDVSGITSVHGVFEDCTLTATSVSGALNIDYLTNALNIYDANAAGNFTFNVRGNSSTTLDSIMGVNQVLSLVVEVPQGTTPYYCTAITVDGSVPSQVKWFGGAPSAGNASGIDVYSITVIKKAAATFYVRASLTQVK